MSAAPASIDAPAARLAEAWQRAYAGGEPASNQPRLPPVAFGRPASRAHADARAAWQRWHGTQLDTEAHRQLSDRQWPWYVMLERARVEVLASRHLPGMALNLAALDELQPEQPSHSRLYVAARRALGASTAPAPPSAPAEAVLTSGGSAWSRWIGRAGAGPSDEQIAQALYQARAAIYDGLRFLQILRPLVQALATHHGGRGTHADRGDHGPMEREPQVQRPHAPNRVHRQGGACDAGASAASAEHADPGYAVYSRAWDEEAPAAHWRLECDDIALRQLDCVDRQQARRLAHRLQRRLQAARLRRWSFDEEEGLLDGRRLSRLLTGACRPRVFRVEEPAHAPQACVTLLVDQSGSMRGRRQLLTALAIDLAVHTLETCHVPCEVLGYTTRYAADNPVAQHWQQAGSPARPGRLNGVRHIVYKSADQPWRRARQHLGLLLREGFGQENLDGEALHWAATRLARRPEARKVLIVLSDGTPYDEATAQANGRAFLEGHLHEVIQRIEASAIRLAAIGAGFDVGRYYRDAATLQHDEEVAQQLYGHLARWLTFPTAPR